MTKKETQARSIQMKAQDLTTLRNRKDLSFEFMENYIQQKKPQFLKDFYIEVSRGSNGKDFFIEKCPEIMNPKAEKPLTKQELAIKKLQELEEKEAESATKANITKMTTENRQKAEA